MTIVMGQPLGARYNRRVISYDPDDPRVRFWPDEADPQRAHLDVRELLEDGGEPYAIIMECVHRLASGDKLILHALMQPRPLMAQLTRMGYGLAIEHTGPDHWQLEIAAP
jgi:uncharacterized protein (DUF2249 family)